MKSTPEEIINNQVWKLLQDIKEEYLATVKGKPVKYRVPFIEGVGIIPRDRKIKILNKLEEEETFKIQRNEQGQRIGTDDIYYLIIDPKKFNEVYLKYQKLCDINTILNDYQEKSFKRESRKKSKSLSYVSDEALEEYYLDEIKLINKLLQICNEQTEKVILMYPAKLADNHTDKAGFNKIETLKDLQKIYKVFRNFSPKLPVELSTTQIIKAEIDFIKLKERAESLHDDIESWKGQVFGIEQQEKNLLTLLKNRFNKSPNQDIYEYSEKILGIYTPDFFEYPLGFSLHNPDRNRPDIRYRFMETMRALEKDGHFIIENVEINFDAQPTPEESSLKQHQWSLGERSVGYYPAEHCNVTLRLRQNQQRYNNEQLDKTKYQNKRLQPEGWGLVEENKKGFLKNNNQVVFTFPRTWSQKFLYFKCIWSNFGKTEKYQNIYEFESNLKYPEAGERTQTNRNIRSILYKLSKEKKFRELPFVIEISGGCRVISKSS